MDDTNVYKSGVEQRETFVEIDCYSDDLDVLDLEAARAMITRDDPSANRIDIFRVYGDDAK